MLELIKYVSLIVAGLGILTSLLLILGAFMVSNRFLRPYTLNGFENFLLHSASQIC